MLGGGGRVMKQMVARLVQQSLDRPLAILRGGLIGLADETIYTNHQGGVGHGIVGAGSAGEQIKRLVECALHQGTIDIPVSKNLEYMAPVVGLDTYIGMAHKSQIGRHHERYCQQQIGEQVLRYLRTMVPKQAYRHPHDGNGGIQPKAIQVNQR